MVSCPCDEREGPKVGKAQLRSLDEHLKSSPSQIDGDGGELGVGQWPHLVVAGNEVPDTVEVYMVCVLNGTSAAPQPEGDVGGEWLVIGELEVDESARGRWVAVGDDVVGGGVTMDDTAGRVWIADLLEIVGELVEQCAQCSASGDRSHRRWRL